MATVKPEIFINLIYQKLFLDFHCIYENIWWK